jgi:hypothetical protein
MQNVQINNECPKTPKRSLLYVPCPAIFAHRRLVTMNSQTAAGYVDQSKAPHADSAVTGSTPAESVDVAGMDDAAVLPGSLKVLESTSIVGLAQVLHHGYAARRQWVAQNLSVDKVGKAVVLRNTLVVR